MNDLTKIDRFVLDEWKKHFWEILSRQKNADYDFNRAETSPKTKHERKFSDQLSVRLGVAIVTFTTHLVPIWTSYFFCQKRELFF